MNVNSNGSSCECDKETVAKTIAAAHRAVEPAISSIYRLEALGARGTRPNQLSSWRLIRTPL
jgi:hypothetical protein